MKTEGTNGAMAPKADALMSSQTKVQGDDATPAPAPMMTPAVNAAYTLASWATPGEGDIDALIVALALQGRALRQGDLTDAERMLMAQASTLDVVFNQLARRAAMSADHALSVCDAYLRLALKAQNQCRATLETLSLVKNPRSVSFVRQANIANGPQQVNNEQAPAPSRARKRKSAKRTIEKPYASLDTRTPQTTIGIDPAMETVEKIHRTANS